MLIAFLENNLCADGSVKIPEVLRKYMGGIDRIVPNDKDVYKRQDLRHRKS